MSGNRISNIDIEKLFSNEENDDLKKRYMGIYSSNVTRYINFHDVINERNVKYLFAIFNIDRNNNAGTHWWSFLDTDPKKICFYLIV